MNKSGQGIAGFVGRFAIVVGGLAFAAIALYRAQQCCSAYTDTAALVWVAAALGAVVASVTLSVLLSTRAVWRLLAEGAVVAGVLITAEIAVTAVTPESWSNDPTVRDLLVRRHAAADLGVPFDDRLVSEVVADLEQQGIEALPAIGRGWPLEPAARARLEEDFYPLSHMSNARIVECNEGGQFLVFGTDELGFNNPPGLVLSGRVEVAVVGDSLALGHCVASGRSTVDLIRAAHPGTANFGMADTRPIGQLASLREYVAPLRPPVVLWFANQYYTGLEDERSHPLLMRYLDPAFSQNLLSRQGAVDAALRDIALPLLAAAARDTERERERAEAWLTRIPRLSRVRGGLDLVGGSAAAEPPEIRLPLFAASLERARETVAEWDGVLIVVILPNHHEAVNIRAESSAARAIRATAEELDVPVIDGAAPFRTHRDPASLFMLRIAGHPTEEGHSLLAELILERLNRNGTE